MWLEHTLIEEEQQGMKLERRPKKSASHSSWELLWISVWIYQCRALEERQRQRFIWDVLQGDSQREERKGWGTIVNTAGWLPSGFWCPG